MEAVSGAPSAGAGGAGASVTAVADSAVPSPGDGGPSGRPGSCPAAGGGPVLS